MRSLFGSGKARLTGGSTASLSALEEPQALEDALHSAQHIMNDDLETAEAELNKANSAFNKLGLSLVSFMRALLGFERELMAEAQTRIYDAENVAYESQKRVQRHPSMSASAIYSPGTEYLLVQAQTQIMAAALGVLTESVSESIKGFYKLRKAFMTLDAILAEEKKYIDAVEAETGQAVQLDNPDLSEEPSREASDLEKDETAVEDSDADEFYDAPENAKQAEAIPDVDKRLSTSYTRLSISSPPPKERLRRLSSQIQDGPDEAIFRNFIDAFVHSSSNMCYGALLLMLSMLPPAFGTLIKIAGFKGDRKRGIALLWQATKFHNLNSAFAGLILLGYYNGFIGFCDILPSSGAGAYPKARCQALLRRSRKQFPKSCLWALEEVRMLSSERKLETAMETLLAMPDSNLKQVRALQCFETGITAMSLHRYELASSKCIKMVGLNNWSHALYYYNAACCLVEAYRVALDSGDSAAAETFAAQAEDILTNIPQHIGRKKMMGRQLPFDIFVSRKLAKWQLRAKQHNVRLVDAVGVSPLAEVLYFWNAFKKMPAAQLELSLARVRWSTTAPAAHKPIPWLTESADERGIYALLSAAILRNMGDTGAARTLLQADVIDVDRAEFKNAAQHRDNWVPPVAHYELAVSYWQDYQRAGDQQDLRRAEATLEVVAAWEAYDLDSRIGARIKTGQDTIRREWETVGGQAQAE